MEKKVSIIVPIYNSELYLKKCVETIMNQTYKNIEVLLINDGSTDNSLQIMKQLAAEDSRIIIFNNPNKGVSFSRNFGVEKASGEYIQFVDSDDILEKDITETMVNSLNDNYTLPLVNIKHYYENNSKLTKNLIPEVSGKNKLSMKQFLEQYVLSYKTSSLIGSPCNKLFIKEILIDNSIMFELNRTFAEDFLFNLEYFKFMKNIVILKKPFYIYRKETENSLTKRKNTTLYWWNEYKFIFEKYKLLFDLFNSNTSDNKREIDTFIEWGLRDSIRRGFMGTTIGDYSVLLNEVKSISHDTLVKKMISHNLTNDYYLKVILKFIKNKIYPILVVLLIIHSKIAKKI